MSSNVNDYQTERWTPSALITERVMDYLRSPYSQLDQSSRDLVEVWMRWWRTT